MNTKIKPTLPQQEKSLMRSLYRVRNTLCIFNESEAIYLLQGHASELINTETIEFTNKGESKRAKIVGIVAKDQSEGRYLAFYLHYKFHIWRCFYLREAYDIIDGLIELANVRGEIAKAEKKKLSKVKALKSNHAA